MTATANTFLLFLSVSAFVSVVVGLGEPCSEVCEEQFNACVDGTCRCAEGYTNVSNSCRQVPCGQLSKPESGDVSIVQNLSQQFEAVFSCRRGYRLEGEPRRVCVDGQWSGQSPVCNLILCPALSQPDHGSISVSDEVGGVDAVVTYSCNPGYQLEGSQTRTCETTDQQTGEWSGDPPVCNPRPCVKFTDSDFADGTIEYDPDPPVYGGMARFVCNQGFQLEGPSSLACTTTGSWSGDLPSCSLIENPPTVVPSTTTPEPTTTKPCSLDCQNGGTCSIDQDGNSRCDCVQGFSGDVCDIEDFCVTQACPDIAVDCKPLDAGRACICPVGKKGDDCTQDDPPVTCRDTESKTVYLENAPDDAERSLCLPETGTDESSVCHNPGEGITYQVESHVDITTSTDDAGNFCVKYTGDSPVDPKVCVTLTAFEKDDINLRPWINATSEICFVLNNMPTLTRPQQVTVGFQTSEDTKVVPLVANDTDSHQSVTLSVAGVLPDTMAQNFRVVGDDLEIQKPDAMETATMSVTVRIQVKDDGTPSLTSTGTVFVEIISVSDLACEVDPRPPLLFHIPDGLPAIEVELGQVTCPNVATDSGLSFKTKEAVGPVAVRVDGTIVFVPDLPAARVAAGGGDFSVTVTATIQQPAALSRDITVAIIADDFRPNCNALSTIEFTERTPVDQCSQTFLCTDRANVSETCAHDAQLFDIVCDSLPGTGQTSIKLCVAESLVNEFGDYDVPVRITNSYGATYIGLQVKVLDVNNPPQISDQLSIEVLEKQDVGNKIGYVSLLDPDVWQDNSVETLSVTLTEDVSESPDIPFRAYVNSAQNGIWLETTGQLDVRVRSSYTLRLTVTDSEGESDSAIILVTVINTEEPPTCAYLQLQASVSVRNQVDDQVSAVQCTDPDLGDTLTYTVQGSDLFKVDGSGVVTVAGSLAGLTNQDSLTIYVIVTDRSGFNVTVTIVITINNSFPPVCKTPPPYTMSISENTLAATCFDVETDCSDEVQNEQLTYTLVSGNGTQYFTIGLDTTGTRNLNLCTNVTLKHKTGSYNVGVRVSSSYGEINLFVTLIVADVNDPPVFVHDTYEVKVNENKVVGSVIVSLSASDPDTGAYGTVTYFSNSIPDMFHLSPDEGTMSVRSSLDVDTSTQNSFVFPVFAVDGAPNEMTASTTLSISILDVNDNAPMCTVGTADVDLQLTDPVDTVVYTLDCSDLDRSDLYSRTGYRLKDSAQQVFRVDSTGAVLLSSTLPRNVENYIIEVEAFDIDKADDPLFTDLVTIAVRVNTAIAPVCDPPSLVMELRETRPQGYCLDDEVKCVDPTGGEVTFVAEAGTGKEYLETRFNTGTDFLGLNACIRKSIKDQFGQYQLRVTVTNGLATTDITWTFTVTDINEPPYFTKRIFETDIDEGIESTAEILNVTVEDPDEAFDNQAFKISSITADLANSADFNNQLDSVILFVERARVFYAVRAMNATVRNLYTYNLTLTKFHGNIAIKWQDIRHGYQGGLTLNPFYVIRAMNATVRNLYTYNLTVTDGQGLYDEATAVINVRDINSPPVCPDTRPSAETTILADVGTAVYTLSCYDTDIDPANTKLSYEITGGDRDNHFNVTGDGRVIVSSKFPRTYLYGTGRANLSIEVRDHGTPSYMSQVFLLVTVDNQIPPECSPVVTPPDIWVFDSSATLTMDCTDPSFPDSSDHLKYTVTELAGQPGEGLGFTIISKGGGVFELKYMLTNSRDFQIQIRVENGLKAKEYVETIQVRYLEATPSFTSPEYTNEVDENFPTDAVILTVQASSAKLIGSLEYRVIGDQSTVGWDSYFQLDQTTGSISTLQTLRGLADRVIKLRIEAEDTGSRLSSATQVQITVVDLNEAPECTITADLDLDVTTDVGTEVVSLTCIDPDKKLEFKTLTYGLTGVGVQGVFALYPDTDAPTAIVTAGLLSVTVPSYTLTISVTDGGSPPLVFTKTFTVNVTLLPPPLRVEIRELTYESILVAWSYARQDFYSVTQGYQVLLTPGQQGGVAIESPVQGAGVRRLNTTGLQPDTQYSLVVKATTDFGTKDSVARPIKTPEVPKYRYITCTILVRSVDFNLLLRNKDSFMYNENARKIEIAVDNTLKETPGYVSNQVINFRPANSVYVDIMAVMNQSATVNVTIEALEKKVNSGWLSDELNVDSGYFVVSPGKGYITIESIGYNPQPAVNGSNTVVTCDVLTVGYTESTEFEFWWTYDSKLLTPTAQSRYTISSSTSQDFYENKQSILQIAPILEHHAGVYGCIAADMARDQVVSRDIEIIVQSQPEVTLTPRSQTVNQGDPVVLVCVLTSDDITFSAFLWYRDGSALTADTQGVAIAVGDGNETLTVNNILRSAVFSCEGRGPAGVGPRVLSHIGVIPRGPAGDILCDITTEIRQGYRILWPTTAAGTVAIEKCPTGYIGEVTRACDSQGVWQTSVFNCRKMSLQQINTEVKAIKDGTGTRNLSTAIEELRQETDRTLLEGDLASTLETMDDIVDIVNDANEAPTVSEAEAEQDTENYLKIASQLIAEDNKPTWQSRLARKEEAGISVPLAVERFIKGRINQMSPSGSYFRTFAEKNVYAEVGKGDRNVYEFPDRSQAGTPSWIQDSGTSIRIPAEAMTAHASSGFGSSFYKKLPEILETTFMKDGEVASGEWHINADTVTFQVLGGDCTLDPPATIIFKHFLANYSDPQCTSWDSDKSAYVTDGCSMVSTSDEETECSCNHCTNFAILMSPGKTPAADLKALSIISAVGCALSIFFLLLTIVCHVMVWRLVKSDRAVLLMNLCVALIIAYIVFLAGVGRAENEDVCTAVSILLHFFYLAVFFLMLAYGIEIGVTIIYVFATSSRIKWLLPLAWGIPLVIVAISAGVTQLDGYGNESFCWLSIESGLLWAFVGPAAFVILFNFIIVIAVFRKMFKSSAMLTKTDKEKAKHGVRSLCVLLPILGLTWVFGVFSVNEELVVFQYIFAVCNSLQGVFIFIFHCVLSKQLKDAFKQRRARKKSLQSFDKSFSKHQQTTSTSTGFYSEGSKPNNDSGFSTETTNPFLAADRQMKEMMDKNKTGGSGGVGNYDNAGKPATKAGAVDLEDVKISNILRESEVMGGAAGISSILQTQSTSLPDTRRVTDDEKGGGFRSSVLSSHKYDYIDSPNVTKPSTSSQKYDYVDAAVTSSKPSYTENAVYIQNEAQDKPSGYQALAKPYSQKLVTSADSLSAGLNSKENLTDKQKGKMFGEKDRGRKDGSAKSKEGSGLGKDGSKISKSSKSSRSDEDYEARMSDPYYHRTTHVYMPYGRGSSASAQNISSISTALPTISYDQYQAKAKQQQQQQQSAEMSRKQESSLKKKDKGKKKPPKDRSKAYEYSFESTYLGDRSRHSSLENMNMQQYSPYAQMPGMGGYATGRPTHQPAHQPTHQQQHRDQYRYPQHQQARQQPRQQYYTRDNYW